MAMLRFPTDLKYVKEASKKVLDFLSDIKVDESSLFDIKLCFEEAFINAVKYGNKFNEQLTIDVDIIKKPDTIEIVVCDQGEGFDFKHCEDPTKKGNITKTHGRGIFLIKNLMDQIQYKRNGSCLHMIKKIKRATK